MLESKLNILLYKNRLREKYFVYLLKKYEKTVKLRVKKTT